MKLTCSDPACERARVRQRDGQWWCLFHPDQPAPDVDTFTGKLRDPGKASPLVPTPRIPEHLRSAPAPADPPEPAVVEVAEQAPEPVATHVDIAVDEPVLPCPTGCGKPARHRGRCPGQPRTASHRRPQPPAAPARPLTASEQLHALSAWIDAGNRDRDREAVTWGRLAKVSEECGEVIAAFIGATGQNPRKGTTHATADVEEELLDVAITALGAVAHLHGNATDVDVLALLAGKISRVATRAGVA